MILTHRYRVLPTKAQHRALERILEDQRQLYNAAMEERVACCRYATFVPHYFWGCTPMADDNDKERDRGGGIGDAIVSIIGFIVDVLLGAIE